MFKQCELDRFAAFIFDMDGTLVDSMPFHMDAWEVACSEFGVKFSREQLCEYGGIPTKKLVSMLIAQQDLSIDADAFVQRKVSIFLDNIDKVKVFPEMLSLVERYHGKVAMGVGTGAPRDQAQYILRSVGLDKYMSVLVSADDVVNHKPNPDTFLKVAEMLDVLPEKSLVFEDTTVGIQAGKSAGMRTVMVNNGVYIKAQINHDL
ncbi:HAD family hydrolase [Aeromonas veronii]|uniref:HAD family hydrolase n=1 Tax=Aeromonas TaxID=642 RepID=UPI0011168E49|nr:MULTISPECIES: HAD family phosphatase [Aeromonas]TNI01475.1 haloacid dehalogenase [Aeromonas veronii]HDO1310174.1 HAD family phosphatase [Aeromonas veronii]HDO1317770.1 HAD family phosphatase [Aeromonas veronii]HDO1331669.1 HAD family phosphatase [Aeromonas veronii]HDO1336312.1 HAD family phosphatase [Aeromonas veronii]